MTGRSSSLVFSFFRFLIAASLGRNLNNREALVHLQFEEWIKQMKAKRTTTRSNKPADFL